MITADRLQALLTEAVAEADPEALPALLGAVEAARAAAWARLTAAAGKSNGAAAEGELLTAGQLAEVLAVPASWLRTAARQGRIPVVKVGTYVRFDPQAVRAALDNGTRRPRRPRIG